MIDFTRREYWDRLAVVTGLYTPDLSYLDRGACVVNVPGNGGKAHSFAAHPGQVQLLDAMCRGERFLQAVCGARFGKSKFGGFIAGGGVMQAEKHIWIVAPTYDMGRKALGYTMDTLEAAGMRPGRDFKFRESRLRLETRWGSFVELKSAEREYSLDSEELDLVLEEEGAKYKPRIRRRLRPRLIDRQGQDLAISTPIGHNFFYDMFEGDEFYSIQMPTTDNPFLPEGELDAMREYYDPLAWKQEIEAKFTSFAGMVFFMFSRDTHSMSMEQAKRQGVDKWPVRVVIDPGLNDPCAITWIANNGGAGSGAEDVIIRSMRRSNMLFPDVARVLNLHEPECGYDQYIYDPFGGDKRSQETNHNFNTWMRGYATTKAGQPVKFTARRDSKQARINAARGRFLNMKNEVKMRVLDCPDTQTIMRSLENWHYPEGEIVRDEPIHDVNSHECDNICNYCGYYYSPRTKARSWIA